jgi:hypothetical protein
VKSSCERGNELSGSIKYLESIEGHPVGGLSSGTQLHRVSYTRTLSSLIKDVFWDFVPCNTSSNRRFGEPIVSLFRVP